MTKILRIIGLACALPMLHAQASDLRMTVEQPNFTCQGAQKYLSRVTFHPADTLGAPLPCCDGKIGCAQFLSTNTIVRQAHQWHG